MYIRLVTPLTTTAFTKNSSVTSQFECTKLFFLPKNPNLARFGTSLTSHSGLWRASVTSLYHWTSAPWLTTWIEVWKGFGYPATHQEDDHLVFRHFCRFPGFRKPGNLETGNLLSNLVVLKSFSGGFQEDWHRFPSHEVSMVFWGFLRFSRLWKPQKLFVLMRHFPQTASTNRMPFVRSKGKPSKTALFSAGSLS